MPRAQLLSRAQLRRGFLGACGGGALAAFAYTNGGYSATTQEYAVIVVWWTVGFFAAVGAQRTGYRLTGLGRVTLALLVALAIWTGLSTRWASDAERAYTGFIRLTLYVGVLVVAIAACRAGRRATLVGALALAIVAIAGASLAAQLFPHALGVASGGSGITATARLSFPLGYWNGLAIFAALGYPLLIGLAAGSNSAIGSAAALAPAPLLAAVIYLASSRGGIAAAALGCIAVVAGAWRRWRTLAVAVVAAAGSALGLLIVHRHGTATHGAGPALALVASALLTAAVSAGVHARARRMASPRPVFGWILAGVAVLVVAVGGVAAHPVTRLQAFKAVPKVAPNASPGFVSAHLLSSSGSGRWQFWSAAVDEFHAHPVAGGGAGSFAAWWTRHRTIPLSVVDVHSAYLQALAELGLVGFLLLCGSVLGGLAGAYRTARSEHAPDELGPALAACFLAFAFAAAIDWVWELPAVAIVALVALGLALAPGVPLGRRGHAGLTLVRAAIAAAAVAVMVAVVVPLLAHVHLNQSYADVRSHDLVDAETQALDARALQPWAATPYTQLALVAEQRGDLATAALWIERAAERAPDDWRVHLIAARIDTKRLQIPRARAELATVRRLNPLGAPRGVRD